MHVVQFLSHHWTGFCDISLKRQMGYSLGRSVGCGVLGCGLVTIVSLSVSSVGSLARTSLFLIEYLFLVAISGGALII